MGSWKTHGKCCDQCRLREDQESYAHAPGYGGKLTAAINRPSSRWTKAYGFFFFGGNYLRHWQKPYSQTTSASCRSVLDGDGATTRAPETRKSVKVLVLFPEGDISGNGGRKSVTADGIDRVRPGCRF